jgi:hypothetical protein
MRDILSAQRHFVPRRTQGAVRHLGYSGDRHNQNSGPLALFVRSGTYRQALYLQAVF